MTYYTIKIQEPRKRKMLSFTLKQLECRPTGNRQKLGNPESVMVGVTIIQFPLFRKAGESILPETAGQGEQ